jgi:hypothetical protein
VFKDFSVRSKINLCHDSDAAFRAEFERRTPDIVALIFVVRLSLRNLFRAAKVLPGVSLTQNLL